MSAVIVRTFPDGRLFDELIVPAAADVQIMRTGEARYDVSLLVNAQQRLALRLWSSRKGVIETRVECDDGNDVAMPAQARFAADGNLVSLQQQDCDLHLEHVSPGHYFLDLQSTGGRSWHLEFITRGYIKCELVPAVVATTPTGWAQ